MRLAELRTQKKNWETELDRMSLVDATPMAPRRALRELELAMPEDAIVVTDLGNICWVANSYVRPARPKSFLTPMSFGNCGYGFPAAMGAKVAAPDRPVVCYVGDGAWGMCAMETLTSIREKIPVTVVILNNRQWGAEKGNQITYFNGRCVGTNLEHPDFTIIAKGMGARGIKVDHHDQVGDALRQAVMSDTTTVIEITVNQDLAPPFRRDAFKKPIRLLDRYKAYSVD
jgi:sulfoacetaldehyde acetyltransferase